MGCPAPKIVKNGDGSKLLLDLELLEKIAKTVVENAQKKPEIKENSNVNYTKQSFSKVPVTAKIRKGWDDNNIVAIEASKILENVGISAITVHGRTREEFYSGEADWEIIKKVKDTVNIPVIGNGDVKSKEDALKMFEETNVDGIMIGRAAIGNPWIFEEIINYMEGKPQRKVSNEERLNVIKEHIRLEVEEKGESTGIKEMRKHLAYYVKNTKHASKIRDRINKIDKRDELIECLSEYFNAI